MLLLASFYRRPGCVVATLRTIRLIVPYPPAGTADIVARLLAEQIGRTQWPSIVIENQAGGRERRLLRSVARATPGRNDAAG